MRDDRQGCFSGLLQLFFLDKISDFFQRTFGYKSGGCCGCGCGTVIFIITVIIFLDIVFGTDFFRFSF